MTHKYKDKEYEVQTGAKGGMFFIDDTGKKHYLKNTNPSPKKQKQEERKKKAVEEIKKPHRYICYYEEYNEEGEQIDDFKEWCDAFSYDEAESEFKNRYRHNSNVKIFQITR